MEQNIMSMIDELSNDPDISEEDLADFILDISFNSNIDKGKGYDFKAIYYFSKEQKIGISELSKEDLEKFIINK